MREQNTQSLIYLLWEGDSRYRMENRWVRTTRDTFFSVCSVMQAFAIGETVLKSVNAAVEVSSSKGSFKISFVIS